MNRLLRDAGFGLIIVGAALVLVRVIGPLQFLWPWVLGLPILIRIGLAASAIGLAVLLGSLIAERIRERDADKDLRIEP